MPAHVSTLTVGLVPRTGGRELGRIAQLPATTSAKRCALPGPQPRAATVTALTNVQSYVLLRSTFQSFMVCVAA